MAKFTGGSARYTRKVNTGNYEHKEFAAEILWSADDGDNALTADEWIERAADKAMQVVHERLGLTEAPVGNQHFSEPTFVDPGSISTLPAANVGGGAETPAQSKRHRSTKAEMEARRATEAAAARYEALRAETLAKEADPLLDDYVAEQTAIDEAAGAVPFDPLTGEVFFGDDDLTALPPDITNGDLQAAAEHTVAKLKNAIAVRKLIGEFAPQLAMIPQERRQSFLDKLGMLAP